MEETLNKLQKLELILFEMRNTNFDYDGRIPEIAQEELIEEINALITERNYKDCKTDDGEHLWIDSRLGYSYCLYCQKEF